MEERGYEFIEGIGTSSVSLRGRRPAASLGGIFGYGARLFLARKREIAAGGWTRSNAIGIVQF